MPAPNDPTLDFYNSERLKEWSNKMAVKEESYGNEVNAGARPPMSNQERNKKRPIDRPCSACSAGDYKMEYHDHEPPYRDEEPVAVCPACGGTKEKPLSCYSRSISGGSTLAQCANLFHASTEQGSQPEPTAQAVAGEPKRCKTCASKLCEDCENGDQCCGCEDMKVIADLGRQLAEALLLIAADWSKYPLRNERHPNDPDKKADEE